MISTMQPVTLEQGVENAKDGKKRANSFASVPLPLQKLLGGKPVASPGGIICSFTNLQLYTGSL
jgi:hypothetical protein